MQCNLPMHTRVWKGIPPCMLVSGRRPLHASQRHACARVDRLCWCSYLAIPSRFLVLPLSRKCPGIVSFGHIQHKNTGIIRISLAVNVVNTSMSHLRYVWCCHIQQSAVCHVYFVQHTSTLDIICCLSTTYVFMFFTTAVSDFSGGSAISPK